MYLGEGLLGYQKQLNGCCTDDIPKEIEFFDKKLEAEFCKHLNTRKAVKLTSLCFIVIQQR